ncbi:alpha/beta hydrolase [Vagococcus vulneris]|nr:alpha/beta hydrolase [Vagococcus vulneris]
MINYSSMSKNAGGSLMARDNKQVKIAFQIPIYPMIDDRMTTKSM